VHAVISSAACSGTAAAQAQCCNCTRWYSLTSTSRGKQLLRAHAVHAHTSVHTFMPASCLRRSSTSTSPAVPLAPAPLPLSLLSATVMSCCSSSSTCSCRSDLSLSADEASICSSEHRSCWCAAARSTMQILRNRYIYSMRVRSEYAVSAATEREYCGYVRLLM
jgi:hypothetical protein